MTDTSLTYHEFDDCLWIRCTNRGSFVNSPALKTISEKYLARGGKLIVVDMEICPGVDSTFMGTLAGLARQMTAQGGFLQIATPTKRTRSAMESLGWICCWISTRQTPAGRPTLTTAAQS